MGGCCSSGSAPPLEAKLLLLGLDGGGKTTILQKLKRWETMTTTTPTIGFNVEQVEYKGVQFTVWDIGGDAKLRSLWQNYYGETAAIIFVIDLADKERFEEARIELWNVIRHENTRGAPILIYANKEDLPGAYNIIQLTDQLDLPKIRGRQWHIQSTTATTNKRIWEGIDWIIDMLNKK